MIDAGVEHLVNAVTISGQPHQLLQVLQQTLPPNIFQLLVTKLPGAAASVSIYNVVNRGKVCSFCCII